MAGKLACAPQGIEGKNRLSLLQESNLFVHRMKVIGSQKPKRVVPVLSRG
jgi:hypothetical protein